MIQLCFPLVNIRIIVALGTFLYVVGFGQYFVSLHDEKWCRIPEFEVVYWAAKSVAISTQQCDDLRSDIESNAMLTAVRRTASSPENRRQIYGALEMPK